MDIRSILNGYFEQTPIPDELSPLNVRKFVVPNLGEKKEIQTEDNEENKNYAGTAQSTAYNGKQTENSVSAQNTPTAKNEENPQNHFSASSLIKVVRYHKLTGREFLELLGNSKIGNKAYQEIENNPSLTVKRLIELLENSPLTSADYEKLIIAVQRMAQLKADAKAKIKSEPSRAEKENVSEKTTEADILLNKKNKTITNILIKKQDGLPKKINVGYVPKTDTQLLKNIEKSNDDDEDEDEEKDSSKEKKEKPEIKIAYKSFSADNGDNDDDDDEDEEDDKKRNPNKGKIIAAAIGVVILIAVSFVLRFILTGSWLPFEGGVTEQKKLSETEIYSALNALSSPEPAFTVNTTYSAGGMRSESIIEDPFSGNKRLLYIENNQLCIYEQIGGQVALLETRDYKENTVLGVIDLENKSAVASIGVSEPYTFSYTENSENDEGENTTVVTSSVSRKETYLEITDADSPEKSGAETKIALSGTLVDAYRQNGRLIIVTYEEMENDCIGEDIATFMPYISIGSEKSFCSAEKVFIASPEHKSFVTIFSLDPNDLGVFDMAASAGGTKQLVSKSENKLFIGQGNTLIRYDLSNGVNENGFHEIPGKISDFSAINEVQGEIRVTSLEESGAVLTVFDENFEKLGEIKNIGVGENLVGTCFYGKETYIITESGICYGIDGENNVMSKSSAKITDENIYKFNENIGVKVTAADDGSKRTGLIISTVKLDGNLTPIYNLEISSKTTAANAIDEYLSSPAETDIHTIGSNAENGALVIPIKYFDGVSEVEMFVICTVSSDGIVSVNGKIAEYDRRSDYIFAQVDGNTVIAVTKGKIITADWQDGNIMGYFSTE